MSAREKRYAARLGREKKEPKEATEAKESKETKEIKKEKKQRVVPWDDQQIAKWVSRRHARSDEVIREIVRDVQKRMSSTSFNRDPARYMAAWKMRRGGTEELRLPEDDSRKVMAAMLAASQLPVAMTSKLSPIEWNFIPYKHKQLGLVWQGSRAGVADAGYPWYNAKGELVHSTLPYRPKGLSKSSQAEEDAWDTNVSPYIQA